jgi:NAD(P)-dependent dehydrogenase (short-subunit alcohol dehydrogenase family)
MSKVWLITGASRGLGRAFTEVALKAGHRVLATARNSEHLVHLASKFGECVRTIPLDVTNEAQAKYAVDAAIKTFGGLDVLVNNAGYGNVSSVEDASLAEFRHSSFSARLRRQATGKPDKSDRSAPTYCFAIRTAATAVAWK